MNSDTISIIKEIKKYAKEENIPIMLDKGIEFLIKFIASNNIMTVLEIGTAIGYSSIMMSLSNPKLKITSVERDEARYLEAIKNIKKLHLEDRITLVFSDAVDFTTPDKYDLVFIDAAKGKNKEFFSKFSKNLSDNGYIITDNINFHGFIEMSEDSIKSRNLRGLIRKIKEYIDFLETNEDFATKFHEVGDGIAVSTPVKR